MSESIPAAEGVRFTVALMYELFVQPSSASRAALRSVISVTRSARLPCGVAEEGVAGS